MAGISACCVFETPVAVIDFETTGLTAGSDRVVEVAVVRINPGEKPRLVFDTLVNPQRRTAASEIHGITDRDVADAPRFIDLVGNLLDAIGGCVVAAYNVYFDIKFLEFELSNAGISDKPPHFCLMYMRPMLGLGCRCKLDQACSESGIDLISSHVAAGDAIASGGLMSRYLSAMRERGIETYGDLANLKSYKFVDSFENSLFPPSCQFNLNACKSLKSRWIDEAESTVSPAPKSAAAQYWDTLKTVVADLAISDDELDMVGLQQQGLSEDQIRSLHARAFACAISQFCDDQRLDDREMRKLKRLHQCLSQLGWAPGE